MASPAPLYEWEESGQDVEAATGMFASGEYAGCGDGMRPGKPVADCCSAVLVGAVCC